MNDNHVEYLKELRMGETLIECISKIEERYLKSCEEPVLDLIVSEYITEAGAREYIRLVFFTANYVLETDKFLTDTPIMWIAKYPKQIAAIQFEPKNYDFKDAISASRLNFNCNWSKIDFMLELKATGKNCDHLHRIVKMYIMRNLTD